MLIPDKTTPTSTAYDEMIDLIVQGGGSAAVLAFRSSDDLQERVQELIERKRDGTITSEEGSQLFHHTGLEHILRMAKIRARFSES